MEPILEFNYKFEGDEEEHIINIQPKSDSIIITIELESKGLYWYKELTDIIEEINTKVEGNHINVEYVENPSLNEIKQYSKKSNVEFIEFIEFILKKYPPKVNPLKKKTINCSVFN